MQSTLPMSYIPPVFSSLETVSYYVILVGLELGVPLPEPQNIWLPDFYYHASHLLCYVLFPIPY